MMELLSTGTVDSNTYVCTHALCLLVVYIRTQIGISTYVQVTDVKPPKNLSDNTNILHTPPQDMNHMSHMSSHEYSTANSFGDKIRTYDLANFQAQNMNCQLPKHEVLN